MSEIEHGITLPRDSVVTILNVLRWAIQEQEKIDPDAGGLIDLYAAYDRMLEALVGEDGARALRESSDRGLKVPRSWAELRELVEPICRWAWPMFSGFARAAQKRYGRNITSGLFLQVCAGVALRMREDWDPAEFPPPLEDDFRRAWAQVLDGEVIDPEYTSDELEAVTINPFATEEAEA